MTFIRHGQSVADTDGLTVAHHVILLSRLGKLQADLFSMLLPVKPALILTSSFIPTRSTNSLFF
jgi:broad specificity phosphatase PhoE